jgi:hypothetical protein
MKRKNGFVPSALDQLEDRVVLSRTTEGLAVVVSGLSPRQRVLNRQQQAFTAEVNQAFQSFSNDYDQARATYFSSIAGQAAPSPATTQAFSLYTTQRVSLLGQQLINIFIQSPRGTAKAPGQPYFAETAHCKQDHRAPGRDTSRLTRQIALAFDSSARHVVADVFALYIEPGQCDRDGAGRGLEWPEHLEERGVRRSEGVSLLIS